MDKAIILFLERFSFLCSVTPCGRRELHAGAAHKGRRYTRYTKTESVVTLDASHKGEQPAAQLCWTMITLMLQLDFAELLTR